MRQPQEDSPGGARRFKVQSTKTARFASVVATAGKPEVYLPLFEPTKDRSFMRAVREHRVLSIRQEPTSKQKDFGVVGFDARPHSAYLVFPKSLKAFEDCRIVGIKYDVVSESSFATAATPHRVKMPKARAQKSPRRAPKQAHPPKPTMPVPQPKEYRVRVRVTTVKEKDVTVEAMTKGEAKKIAQAEFAGEGKARAVSVSEV